MDERVEHAARFILDAFVTDPERFLTVPEDQWFDRKGFASALRDIAKVLVAFANAEGGAVAIGASREHGLGGARAHPNKGNEIRQVAIDLTEPPVRHAFHLIPCFDRRGESDELIVLEVEPSERMHRLTNGSVWLRVGDETRELDHEQAVQLGYDKGVSYFDSERAMDVTIEDLNTDAAEQYRALLQSRLEPRELLEARGLYRSQGANAGVTWAGLLLFGRQPDLAFPQAYVRLLRYEGVVAETGVRMNLVHDQRLEGTIPFVIEQVKTAVPPLIRTLTRLGTSGRFESIANYPEAVWFEAIVNALVHRSYALHGDHIRVRIFDDRLEVESPGRLPGLVRPDNIRTTRYSRNPRIARVLAEMGHVRELGEGVDRMFDEMSAFGLPSPEFRQGAASVIVTLFNNRRVRQRRLIAETVPNVLLPVVDRLMERGRVTTGEVMELLGVSRPTAGRYLAQLRDLGWVKQIASSPRDPTAYWRLNIDEGLADDFEVSVL